ncbi:T9SS type A sorting domain-containing protein [bacterium]|nr:T9SS type A sorting domain-containing protein [bacterium]
MKKRIITSVVIFLITMLLSASLVSARSADLKGPESPTAPLRSNAANTISLSPDNLPLTWPVCAGVLQTSSIITGLTSFGTFGISDGMPCEWECSALPWPCAGFESPPGIDIEYLFVGAIWIGGVVGRDTLVSVGIDGWQSVREMYPPLDPAAGFASIRPCETPTGSAFRGEFTDTLTAGVPGDYFGRPHLPMNLKIAMRGYASDLPGDENFVLYDAVITNMGSDSIHDGYVALYVDGDAYHPLNWETAGDDLAGYLPASGIAYIIDNDGEPVAGSFSGMSPVRGVGAKLLSSSEPSATTKFNWWVSSEYPDADYGPMRKDEYRDYLTGGSGTPEGDANKYYLMSRASSDFDQVFTAAILPTDPVWIAPNQALAQSFADGADTRFLLSHGPIELPPNAHLRLQFALFTADSIHVDPNNAGDNLMYGSYDPVQYLANLQLDRFVASADAAELFGASLLDPNLPVAGVSIQALGGDSAVVRWDPWVLSNILGYNLKLESIQPSDSFPYPGAIPPWWTRAEAGSDDLFADQDSFVLHGLATGTGYAVRMSHVMVSGYGALSEPVFLRDVLRPAAPVASIDPFVVEGSPARISWTVDETAGIDHFAIYRIADSSQTGWPYHAYYDEGQTNSVIPPLDNFQVDGTTYYYHAMTPIGTADKTATYFDDSSPLNIGTYVVASVDSNGFESVYSNQVSVVLAPIPSKDVLVLTTNTYVGMFNYYDSVVAFYDRTLAGLDYGIVNMYDSIYMSDCDPLWDNACPDLYEALQYRLIILDDKELPTYGDELGQYDKVLEFFSRAGRKVAVFGSTHGFDYSFSESLNMPGEWRPVDRQWVRTFGIDSMFYQGPRYCSPNLPCSDTLTGFVRALPEVDGLPTLEVSTTSVPWSISSMWDLSTPPFVEAYQLADDLENSTVSSIYQFDAAYASSLVDGSTVGIRCVDPDSSLRYVFGFHFYVMNSNQSRELVDWLLLDAADTPTDVPGGGDGPELPTTVQLEPNYPNPFNPTTTIRFSLPTAGDVRIEVFNILGQKVRTLLEDYRSAGSYSVVWDGRSDGGDRVSSGVYFYRLTAGETRESRKMLLLR